jgi:hypothetical protein
MAKSLNVVKSLDVRGVDMADLLLDGRLILMSPDDFPPYKRLECDPGPGKIRNADVHYVTPGHSL